MALFNLEKSPRAPKILSYASQKYVGALAHRVGRLLTACETNVRKPLFLFFQIADMPLDLARKKFENTMRQRRLADPSVWHSSGFVVRRSGSGCVGAFVVDNSRTGSNAARDFLRSVAGREIEVEPIAHDMIDFKLCAYGVDREATGAIRLAFCYSLPAPRRSKVYSTRVDERFVARVRELRESGQTLRAISSQLLHEGWTSARNRPPSFGIVAAVLKRSCIPSREAPAPTKGRGAYRERREPMPWC